MAWRGNELTNGTYTVLANRQKDTFVHGFLDVSGRVLIAGNLVLGSGGNIVMTPTFSSSTISPNSATAIYGTWFKDDVYWSAKASSFEATTTTAMDYMAYRAFDNTYNVNNRYVSPLRYNNGSTIGTTAVTSNVNEADVTSITGEWIQISSSVPLKMLNYKFGSPNDLKYFQQTYYIIGSNNETVWFAIQKGQLSAQITGTTNTLIDTQINIGTTGQSSLTYSGTTLTLNTYLGSERFYKYFRLVSTKIGTENNWILGEWLLNFTKNVNTFNIQPTISDSYETVLNVATNSRIISPIDAYGFHARNGIYSIRGKTKTAGGSGQTPIICDLNNMPQGIHHIAAVGTGNRHVFAYVFWIVNITSPTIITIASSNYSINITSESKIRINTSQAGDVIHYNIVSYPTPNSDDPFLF